MNWYPSPSLSHLYTTDPRVLIAERSVRYLKYLGTKRPSQATLGHSGLQEADNTQILGPMVNFLFFFLFNEAVHITEVGFATDIS
jgi:hypothetical protein